MININNKHELEIAFSNDFGSPYFPILADIYMREGDINRSKRVCEIGLQHCPENNFGKFVLAKIAIAEEKPTVAERWLKQVVSENPGNFKALRMLIRLEVLLKRSIKTIQSNINIILERLPADKECHDLLDELSSGSLMIASKTTKNKSPSKKEKKEKSIAKTKISYIENKNYKLENSMATLSMLAILKKQKHYKQALVVLNILESKNIDPPRIIKEKQEIQSLIKHSYSTKNGK